MANLNKSHSQAALVNSITEGIKLQSQNRPQRSRKNANDPENPNNTVMPNSTADTSGRMTPVTPVNPAIQSDSSQGATININNSNGLGIVINNANQQNSNNSISQPASSPAVSGIQSTDGLGVSFCSPRSNVTFCFILLLFVILLLCSIFSFLCNIFEFFFLHPCFFILARDFFATNYSIRMYSAILCNVIHHWVGTTSRNSTTPSPNPSNQIPKPAKRQKSLQNSENDSAGSSAEAETGGGDSMVDTEGEGPSESDEIELVFKPHPTEMAGDNSLIKALKENSIRYIKTTANATGNESKKPNNDKRNKSHYNFCINADSLIFSRPPEQIPRNAFNIGLGYRIVGISQAFEFLHLYSTVSRSAGSPERFSDVETSK